MTGRKLTKIVADRCGIWQGMVEINRFDPLHDWKDLMNIVVPILFETHWIHMCDDRFLISPNDTGQTRDGSYPAEFARKVCEALVEADND